MTLYFHNPGEIDLRGATIAGLSAKDSDSPIGFFGTGLKYSIASILRWGGNITIHAGLTRHTFSAQELEFRGKSFSQIFHNDQPLGFTTEYGKNWEPWQVFRELYANALDEDGSVNTTGVAPQPDRTVVVVNCTQLETQYFLRDSIILPRDRQPSWQNADLAIYKAPGTEVYYRGVRVWSKPSALMYSLLAEQKLTEDRTLHYSWSALRTIARGLQVCTDESLIELALQANEPFLEYELTFESYQDFSPEFLETASRLYRQNPVRHKRLKEFLSKHKAEVVGVHKLILTPMQEQMFARAKKLVAMMGFEGVTSATIFFSELGKDTLGQYEDGVILLSPILFEQGTKQLVSTLYEEMLHQETGLDDCCYQMQTHLFNKIVSLHEEHVFREPC